MTGKQRASTSTGKIASIDCVVGDVRTHRPSTGEQYNPTASVMYRLERLGAYPQRFLVAFLTAFFAPLFL